MHNFNKVFNDYRRALFNTFWFVPALVSLMGPLLGNPQLASNVRNRLAIALS